MDNTKLEYAIILFKNEMHDIQKRMEDFYIKISREMITFALLNPEE